MLRRLKIQGACKKGNMFWHSHITIKINTKITNKVRWFYLCTTNNTRCLPPPPPHKKEERRTFSRPCDLKVSWYFLHHYIKQLLQKRKIPRSLNLIEEVWFYVHFLKHSHCKISLGFLRPLSVVCVGNGLSYARFRLRCIFCWNGSMGFPQNTIIKRPFQIQFFAPRWKLCFKIWA